MNRWRTVRDVIQTMSWRRATTQSGEPHPGYGSKVLDACACSSRRGLPTLRRRRVISTVAPSGRVDEDGLSCATARRV